MTKLNPLQEEALKLYDAGLNIYPSRKQGKDKKIQELYERRVPRESIQELFETDCNIGVVTGGEHAPYPFVIVCRDDATFHQYIQKVGEVTNWKIWAVKHQQGGDIWLVSGYQRVKNISLFKDKVEVLGSRQSKHLLPPSTNPHETYNWYRRDGDAPPKIYMSDLNWDELKPEAIPVYETDSEVIQMYQDRYWNKVRKKLEKRFLYLCKLFDIPATKVTIQDRINRLLLEKKYNSRKRLRLKLNSNVSKEKYNCVYNIIAYINKAESFIGTQGGKRLAVFIAILYRIIVEQKHYRTGYNRPFRATTREIAELVDIDKGTVSLVLKWFCTQGYLIKMSEDTSPGIYKFSKKVINGYKKHKDSLSVNRTLSTEIYRYKNSARLEIDDPILWSSSALSIRGAQLYYIFLDEGCPLSIQQIVTITKLSQSKIQEALNRLESFGLIQTYKNEKGHKYCDLVTKSHTKLPAIIQLGLESRAQRREKHEKQRDDYLVKKLKANLK